MAQKTESIIIPLKFTADTGEFLKNVSQMETYLKNLFDSGKLGEEGYKGSLKELEKLKQGFNDLGKNNGLSKAVKNFNTNLSKNLQSSTSQVKNFSEGFASIEGPIKRSETALDKFGRTLANSLRYNLVNNFVDAILSKGQEVITFLEDVDKNLTNIRIVSGKSQSEMAGFLETSMDTAKGLGSVTNDYLKASEIYYQQGLSTSEVIERTNATVQAANISSQSVSSTADQATAILNGFNVEASRTVEVLDKIAQVGAGTATDFEEIAKASQKVAASASDANFTIDQTLGMIATISSVTREAPEAIGTSLNAIIGRFNDLKVKNSEYTSNIEKIFKSTGSGLSVFDEATGQLKDIPQILDEVAAAWDTLSENAQKAITTQMAGTRQANRLRALLGNYDMYKEYTAMSEDSEGALARQNAIYMESLEGIQNQAQVSAETLYGELFNTDMLKNFYSTLSEILDLLTNVARKTGGLQGIFTSGAALLRKPLVNAIAPSVARWGQNTFGNKEQKAFDIGIAKDEADYNATSSNQIKLLRYKEMGLSLTEREQEEYAASVNILKQQAALRSKVLEIEKNISLEVANQGKLDNKKIAQQAEKQIKDIISSELLPEKEIQKISSAKSYSDLGDKILKQETLTSAERSLEKLKDQRKELVKELKKENTTASEEDIQNIDIQIKKYEELINQIKKVIETANQLEQDAVTRPKNNENILKSKEGQTVLNTFSTLTEDQQKVLANTIAEKTGNTNAYEILTKQKIKSTNEEKTAVIAAANEEIAALKKASQAEIEQANKTIESNNKREQESLNKIKLLSKGTNVAKIFDTVSKGAIGLAGGLQFMNTIMDDSLTSSQKLEGALSGLGATLSLLPGPVGAFGMALSVLGPILLEITGIGQSEFEKLNNKIDAAKEATLSFTNSINQQMSDLSSIESTYDDLAKAYQNTGLTYEKMTEEQRSQYSQVAEYIENYAPELIKYYNTEGQAILDLSKAYTNAENGQKSYLRQQAEMNQYLTYSQLTGQVGENANLLGQNYALNIQEVENIKTKIASVRQEALTTGKDMSEQLSSLEQQLATHQQSLNNIASDWNELVTKPTLYGNAIFQNLSGEMQNSLMGVGSYNSYLDSSLSSDAFISQINVTIDALSSLTQEQANQFNSLTDSMRQAVIGLGMELQMSSEQLVNYFSQIRSEADFLKGNFLSGPLMEEMVQARMNQYSGITKQAASTQEDISNAYQKNANELSIANQPYNQGTNYYENLKQEIELDVSISEESLEEAEQQIEDLEEKVRNFQEDQERASKGNANLAYDMSEEDYEEFFESSIYEEWGEQIRDFAEESEDNFKAVGKAYEELVKDINDAETNPNIMSKDQVKDMEKQADQLYSVLMGNDENYFNAFKDMNQARLAENEATYGIDANNYKTLNEYKNAIDAETAKYKQLLDQATVLSANELNIQAAQIYQQTKANELIAAGSAEAGKVMLAVTGAQSKEQAEAAYTDYVLGQLETQLTAEGTASNSSLDIIYGQLQAAGTMHSSFAQQAAKLANDLAGATISSGGTISVTKGSNAAMVKSIQALREKLKESMGDAEVDQGKLDAINSIMNDYLSQIQGGYNLPGYGSMGMPSFGGGGGGSSLPSSPSGGSGGGGGGGGSEKEVEDLKLDLDPLKRYNDLLEQIDHELSIIEEQKDRVYGNKYVEAINKEIELNKESLKVQQDKLEKIKELEKEQQDALKKQGVEFDEDGLISNYNELLEKKQAEANKLSGDAKESAKEAVEDLQDAMDKYEDDVIDSRRDALEAIEEIKTELADLAVEKIQYTIELIVDATEEDTDLIEFIADAQRLKKGKFNFSIVAEESAKQLINSLQGIQDIFAQTGDANKFINDILTNPDLEGNTQAQMDLIKEQQEQMQDLASDLMDFAEELGEAFADGLDEALDLLEDEFDRYENIIGQYEYILDIAEGLNLDNFDNLNNLYSNITSIYRNNIEQSKQAAEIFKNSRDQFEKGTEEWILANDKYMEMQAQVLDQESELADLLEQKYDTAMESGRLKLEEILFGGKTLDEVQEDLDKINKERKKYLDTETKIYNLSKLERQINKDIQGYQYDPETQAALKKFMNDELKYLNAKEKLTQTDLDLATKQYNVVKARIDLERAYNSEQYQMMLQRNADGTFGYMYVQNTDAIEDAKRAYEDAVNELYQFASEKNDELQQESIDIRSDALDEYDKIVERLKDGTISEEEAVQQLNKAFEDMKKNLEENAQAQAEMQQQMASAKLLQILGVSESELDNLDSLEEKLTKTFDILNNNGEVNNLSETIKALGLNAEDYTGTVGEQVSQIYKDLGANEEALEKMMEAFANSGDATAATILGLLQKTGDLSELTQDILNNSLAGAGDSFDSMIDRITSGLVNTGDIFNESFKNGLEGVDELWENLSATISADLEEISKEFDPNNPEGALSEVTNGILAAYQEWQKALEDSYQDIVNRNDELINITEEYNNRLQDTINKTNEELTQLTELTKKYQGLREEILASIDEVIKYIEILDQAKNEIETEGGIHSSGAETEEVEITEKMMYSSPYSSTPIMLTTSKGEFYTDGSVNNKVRVKSADGSYVGWFDPNSLATLHGGGQIDVNKEGLALVKKNEAVFTEQELSFINGIKDVLYDMQSKINIPQMINSDSSISQNIQIHASFPNANNADEIEKAFESLYINSSQYINKK